MYYIYIYIYIINTFTDKIYGEKRCEIQGGSQEMAVMVRRLMVKILIMTIQVNFVPRPNCTKIHLNCCY